MVHLALPAVAVLALTPMIGAVAVPATNEPQTEMFSWYKWIDAKIKNPEGDHLTPDQAVAAWEASLNATVAHRSLDMRAVDPCFVVQGQKRAFVSFHSCVAVASQNLDISLSVKTLLFARCCLALATVPVLCYSAL